MTLVDKVFNHKAIPWWVVDLDCVKTTVFERVINSNFPNEGPVTYDAEQFLSKFLNVKHAILTTSGTVALFLALKSKGIGKGCRVAVPNLTFIATANAVSLTGAEVVLVDVSPESLTIDIEKLKQLDLVKKIDAVIPVHISGRSAFNLEFQNWIKSSKTIVIEDAAEAFGSKDPISGKFLGTLGDVGAFSFSPNKLITSGQGGLVVTDSDKVASEVRKLKDQGRSIRGTGGDDLHPSLGFNFKYTDIQASILLNQFEQIKNRISKLTEVYNYYSDTFNNSSGGRLLKFDVTRGEFPLWPEFYFEDRIKIESKFDSNKIGFRRIWFPLSTQNPYKQIGDFENSIKASKSVLWLPSNFKLSKRDLRRIVQTVNGSIG
jgi:perosamine synthetase